MFPGLPPQGWKGVREQKTCPHNVTEKFITSWVLFCLQGTESLATVRARLHVFPEVLRFGCGKQL